MSIYKKTFAVFRGFSGAVLFLVAGLLISCGKSDRVPTADPNAGLSPEAVVVRQAFETSGPSYRNPVEEALALVRAGQVNPAALSEALPQLERIAANTTISAAQKQALTNLIEKIKAGGVKAATPKDIH